MSKRYPDALACTPATARDHCNPAYEFDDQPRWGNGDCAYCRSDGAASPAIASAFAAVRNSYNLIELNSEIDALDNKISGKVQLDLYAALQDLLLDRLVWFLRNVDLTQGLEKIIGRYREAVTQLESSLATVLSKSAAHAWEARVAALVGAGVPASLAQRIGVCLCSRQLLISRWWRTAPANLYPK